MRNNGPARAGRRTQKNTQRARTNLVGLGEDPVTEVLANAVPTGVVSLALEVPHLSFDSIWLLLQVLFPQAHFRVLKTVFLQEIPNGTIPEVHVARAHLHSGWSKMIAASVTSLPS
jgi:hypothetical protein